MQNITKLPSSFVPNFARGLEILVVDHDTKSLGHLASLLEQYTYKVTTTALASVALSLVEQHEGRFKLIMASVSLPDMNSVTFLRAVLKKGIPIILIATERSIIAASRALEDGASFYLDKPISLDDVKYVWQLVYRKGSRPRNINQNKISGVKKKHGKKSRGRRINEVGRTSRFANGNFLHGTSHQNATVNATGNGKEIDVEVLHATNNQQIMIDTKGKGKQVEGDALHVTNIGYRMSDSKRKGKLIEWDVLHGTSHHQYVMVDSNDNGKQIEDELWYGTNDDLMTMTDPKRQDKQTDEPENALVEKNCMKESENTGVESLVTLESLIEGGSKMKRPNNDDEEGKKPEKRTKINIEQVNSDDKNTIGEEEKEGNTIEEEEKEGNTIEEENGEHAIEEENKEGNANEEEEKEENPNEGEKKEGNANGEEGNTNEGEENEGNSIEEEGKERKTEEEEEKERQNSNSSSSKRKSRVIWTPDLHLKFTAALSALGDRKARPKSILKMMNVPTLTKRQIASHLQKYKAQVQRLCETGTNNLSATSDSSSVYDRAGNSETSTTYLPAVTKSSSFYGWTGICEPSTTNLSPVSKLSKLYGMNGIANYLESSQVLAKASAVGQQLEKRISELGIGGGAHHFSRTPGNIYAPDYGSSYSSQYRNQIMATTAATQGLEYAVGQFTSGNLPNASKFPTDTTNMSQQLNDMAILNPYSGRVHNEGQFPNFTHGYLEPNDMPFLNPAVGNMPNTDKFVAHDFTNGHQELNAMAFSNCASGHMPNVNKFLTDFSNGNQEVDVMAIMNPASDTVPNLDNYLTDFTAGNQKPDASETLYPSSSNMPNINMFPAISTYGNQQLDVMAISNPASGNALNADKFLTSDNMPANVDEFLSYGNQEVDTIAVADPLTGPSNLSQPPSENNHLWNMLEEDPLDFNGLAAEPNPCDVGRYFDWLREVLLENSP